MQLIGSAQYPTAIVRSSGGRTAPTTRAANDMISIRQVIVPTVTLAGIVLGNGVFAQSSLGVISRQAAVIGKNFDIADKNRDGFLSKGEADAGYRRYFADHFSAIDIRREGKISRQEVVDYWKSSIQKSNERSTRPAPEKAGS